jgi:hypothetical protein
MVPERHNNVKGASLMDWRQPMDEHIHRVKRCFQPIRVQTPEFYYSANCVYDFMWKEQPPPFQRKVCHLGHPAQVQQGLQISLWATRPSPYDLASPAAKRGIQQRRVRLALNADAAADHHLPNAFHQPFELQGVAVLKSISAIQHWCSSVPYPPMVMALKTPCGSAK